MKSASSRVPHPTWHGSWQQPYLEDAVDALVPLWLRVESVALARHGGDLHAPLGRGELEQLVGVADSGTLRRAIRTAVERGRLSPKSNRRCLVLLGHRVKVGTGKYRGGRECMHDG